MNVIGDRGLQRVGEHARRHRRVEQAEVEQIGVDRVEPLAGLGQHLEAGPQPIDRAWPSRRSARRGPRRAARASGSRGRAPRRAPSRSVRSRSIQRDVPSARKSRAVAAIPSFSTVSTAPSAPSRLWISADQVGAVGARVEERRPGVLGLRPVTGRKPVGRPRSAMTRISRGPGGDGESTDSIRGSPAARARSDGCQSAETAHQTARASSSLTAAGGSWPSYGTRAISAQPSPAGSSAVAEPSIAAGPIP